jgi:chromosome segregation ATPase
MSRGGRGRSGSLGPRETLRVQADLREWAEGLRDRMAEMSEETRQEVPDRLDELEMQMEQLKEDMDMDDEAPIEEAWVNMKRGAKEALDAVEDALDDLKDQIGQPTGEAHF